MLDAAVEKVIDFREADPLDPRWNKRMMLLLHGLDRKKRFETEKLYLQFYAAQVANASLTEQSFRKSQQNAKEALYDAVGSLTPWDGRGYADRKKKELAGDRQTYIDAYGADPADPKFKTWMDDQMARAIVEHETNGPKSNEQWAADVEAFEKAVAARRQKG